MHPVDPGGSARYSNAMYVVIVPIHPIDVPSTIRSAKILCHILNMDAAYNIRTHMTLI